MKITKLLQIVCLLMCIGISPMKSQDLKFGEDKKFKIVPTPNCHSGHSEKIPVTPA